MTHAAPPSRYDLPWKTALTHAFRDFMAFFFRDIGDQLDWKQRPRFRDKELAGISFSGATDLMVADKLVEVRQLTGNPRQLLIHIEVQTQRDASLASRIFDYNYRIHKEHGHPVSSLVVLADEDAHWRPCAFQDESPGTTTTISFSTVKLLDYAARSDELLTSDNPFAWLTLVHLRTQQAHHDPDALYAAKWQFTKLLYQHGWSKRRIMVLFYVINWMIALPEPYQRRYWQAVLKLEKEHKMRELNPLEQMFVNDGLQKGLKQGLERGRREGAHALLERQLIRRFGPLPSTARSKLAKAGVAQLEAWSDALPEAESLQQLLK